MEEPETEVISRRKSFRPIAVARTQGIVLRRRREARAVGVDIFVYGGGDFFWRCYMGVRVRAMCW